MKKFLFLFFSILLFADINITQYRDPKFLHTLLHTIETNSTKSEELLLEKTLIQKILQPAEPARTIELSPPKTQKELIETIEKGLELLHELQQLSQRQEEIEQKINSLKKQLAEEQSQVLALQLAYHQKELDALLQQKNALAKVLDRLKLYLSKEYSFDTTVLEKKIEELQNQLAKLQTKIEQLKLKIERYRLINDQKSVVYLEKIHQKYQNQLLQIKQQLLAYKIALMLAKLQAKDPSSIAYKNRLLQELEPQAKEFFLPLFNQLAKERLGFLKTVKLSTFEIVKNSLQTTLQYLQKPIFTIGNKEISLLQLILALLWLIVGFFIGTLYKRSINNLQSHSISSSTKTLLANLGYYFFLILFFFLALNTLQVDLSSIALIAGALSVGIGFGLQNIVSNFVSGIILMFERSIKIGDYIEIDDHLRGRVTDIRMRSTTINTNDNIDIVIPNQTFIQNNLINWTMNDRIRRFQIPFGVAYGTNPQKVIDVVLQAVKSSGFSDIVETKRRKTRVIMTGMGNSSVDFKLFVWIKGEEVFYPERTTSRFLILIYNALYEAGIEIPFPQRDLHIRSIDQNAVLTINLKEKNGSASSDDSGHR